MKQLFVVAIALLCVAPAGFAQQQKPVKKETTQHKVYTCPMHPQVTSDKPGKCPRCGMTLVEKKTKNKPVQKAKSDTTMKM